MASMTIKRHFTADDSMVDLVGEDFNILPILSRFRLPLGFGNKTIGEVCEEHAIDTEIFLLIINFILTGKIQGEPHAVHAATGIVDFLHNSHSYFLNYKFPHIRVNLVNALDSEHSDINPAIINFFDSYVEEARKHFEYEELTLFPYIRALADGDRRASYSAGEFKRHHEEISEKISDLKNIILRYYTTSTPNLMYDALVDIYNCEDDLAVHTNIENNILVPMVTEIERTVVSGEHTKPQSNKF